MAVMDSEPRDGSQRLLDQLIDLLEETRDLMGGAVTDLREARRDLLETGSALPPMGLNGSSRARL